MDLVKIVPTEGVPREYLYAALRWSDFADNVKNHANGANVLHLHPDHIKAYELPVPSPETRLQFTQIVQPLFALSEALEKKNANLRAQRDLLLPKLVSGEIDVSDIPLPDEETAVA